jgi:cyclic beta-1,2-glucan synthetase
MYRTGLESILGLVRHGPVFSIAPCIPASWPGFRIGWRFGTANYDIRVENPARQNRGVASVTLDGTSVDPAAIPLTDDGATHLVVVVIGTPDPDAHEGGRSRRARAGTVSR